MVYSRPFFKSLPFIFNPQGGGSKPNNNPDQFAICRFDMDSLQVKQVVELLVLVVHIFNMTLVQTQVYLHSSIIMKQQLELLLTLVTVVQIDCLLHLLHTHMMRSISMIKKEHG